MGSLYLAIRYLANASSKRPTGTFWMNMTMNSHWSRRSYKSLKQAILQITEAGDLTNHWSMRSDKSLKHAIWQITEARVINNNPRCTVCTWVWYTVIGHFIILGWDISPRTLYLQGNQTRCRSFLPCVLRCELRTWLWVVLTRPPSSTLFSLIQFMTRISCQHCTMSS